MSRILKTLLLWLLMAMLPAQGMAVAIRGACCPAQHQAASVAMSPMSHLHHGMDDHAEHSQLAAHDHDTNASKAADAGTDRHSSQTHDTKHTSGGSCAACYGAAAPLSFAWIAAAPAASDAVDLSPAVWPGSHVPAGLERPPKPLSA